MEYIYSKYNSGDWNYVLDLISRWYNSPQKVLELITKNEPSRTYFNMARLVAMENERLVNQCKITGIPAVFINGYKLSSIYDPKDIEPFIYDITKFSQI